MKRVSPAVSETQARPDLERFLGLTVNTLGRNIVWSLTQRTERFGVMPGAYAVIAWLMRIEDATQAELSRLIGVEQPTMAITLQRMERDGLIERRKDQTHGRRSRVRLTPHGREVSQEMGAAARKVEALAGKGISSAEMDEFFRLADLMIENLTAERREGKV